MKAAVTTGKPREIVIQDVPKPEVKPGQVLMKTIYCGICGSDLEYLDGTFEATKPYDTGNVLRAGGILGHEWVGEVVEMGEGVEGYSIGDHLALGGMRRAPCGKCYFCRRGKWDLCNGGRPLRTHMMSMMPEGYAAMGGAMAEYFVKPGGAKIPKGVTDEQAATLDPVGVGIGSVQLSEIKEGDSLAILGAGRIGLAALMYAKMIGASPVIITDVVPSRLELARKLGADAALNANEVDVVDEAVKLTEAGPDAVCVIVRNGLVFNQAVDMVRFGGTIALTGFVPPVEINPGEWIDKQIRVLGRVGGPRGINVLRLMAQKLIDPTPLISAVMPLDDVQKGFDSMYSGKNILVLLKP